MKSDYYKEILEFPEFLMKKEIYLDGSYYLRAAAGPENLKKCIMESGEYKEFGIYAPLIGLTHKIAEENSIAELQNEARKILCAFYEDVELSEKGVEKHTDKYFGIYFSDIEFVKKLAEGCANDKSIEITAQKRLSQFYIETDFFDESLRYLRMACENEDKESMWEMAAALEDSDLEGSAFWYEKIVSAIEKNSVADSREERMYADSLYHAAVNCLTGRGVSENHDKAFHYMLRAAELDFSPAQFMIAEFYRNGIGTKSDPAKAYRWYCAAADKKDPNALVCAGICCFYGYGTEKNLSKAAANFEESALLGNSHALLWSGRLLLCEDPASAAKRIEEAAKHRNGPARAQLAVLYQNGEELYSLPRDHKKAFDLYTQALSCEDCPAFVYFELGKAFLERNMGVKKNIAKGICLLFAGAAFKGSAEAMRMLSYCYSEGIGVQESREQKQYWLSLAEETEKTRMQA